MNGIPFGTLQVIVVLVALFLFAFWYDRWISGMGASGEGLAWAQVVGGVFITLIAIGILDILLPSWNAFFTGLMAFAVSGFPMAYGAKARHDEAMGRARQAMKE